MEGRHILGHDVCHKHSAVRLLEPTVTGLKLAKILIAILIFVLATLRTVMLLFDCKCQ